MKHNYLSLKDRTAYHRLEDVVGCKWSAGVIAALHKGVHRPGELERYIPGISKKILHERLRKLLDYGLIERQEIPDTVLHVEYSLTATGERLAAIIRQLQELGQEHDERSQRV